MSLQGMLQLQGLAESLQSLSSLESLKGVEWLPGSLQVQTGGMNGAGATTPDDSSGSQGANTETIFSYNILGYPDTSLNYCSLLPLRSK